MHAASALLLIPSLSAGSYDRHLSSLFPFPLSLSDPSGDPALLFDQLIFFIILGSLARAENISGSSLRWR